jgi:uncharacterized membrane protein YdbT with pleckstrin-like domain
MSYVDRNLLPEERVVFRTRLHWIVYALPGSFVLAGVVVLALGSLTYRSPIGQSIGGLVLLLGLLVWFTRWVKVKTSEYAVTTKRIVIKVGFMRRYTLEMLYRQVEAIAVDQGLVGRLFGYGTIKIIGTGGTVEPFSRISEPLEFRRQVQIVSVA